MAAFFKETVRFKTVCPPSIAKVYKMTGTERLFNKIIND
ncbi:hypothetical protein HMPREF9127_0197 [Parvimonas sp. oral taxon 393 str. F0440]|nr:hypothetical protein HMPREF9127_0197 [Parvimonas sp. oral taxon 393 str. F0440]